MNEINRGLFAVLLILLGIAIGVLLLMAVLPGDALQCECHVIEASADTAVKERPIMTPTLDAQQWWDEMVE